MPLINDIPCKHKDSGAQGIIWHELPETKDHKAQWGIKWEKGAYERDMPNHYTWNDKDKIIILDLIK